MSAAAVRACTPGTAARLGFERAVRVIESLESVLAQQFVRYTDVLLHGVTHSAQGDAAWTGGLLNRTGAPLEFSFASHARDLRYTVEVGDPGMRPACRLREVDELLAKFGARVRETSACARFRGIQGSGPLAFGAWLGLRHRRGERAASFKVYAEVPDERVFAASELLREYLGARRLCPASRLVLLGGEPDGERCEFYFELTGRGLAQETLRGMLERAGLEAKYEELVDLIRSFEFRQEARSSGLPLAQYGFSYASLPGLGAPAFSLFVFAPELVGGDGLIRRQAIACASERGWNLGCYAAVTEPMGEHYFESAYHNMIAFTACADAVGFQVAVCPPPEL